MAKNETRVTITADDRASSKIANIEQKLGDLDQVAGGLTGSFGAAQNVVSRFGAALPLGPVGGFAAGVGAVGAAALGATHKLAGFVKEQSNLASLANMTLQDFSNVAYAFERVGVNADQTADIIKDTNDRLGEFAITGKGGFADALEAMGGNANALRDELEGLAGPDALIAVKKYMDEANLSGQEQTYVMETLANDATKLIPLLANQGEELKRLAGEHARVNDTMDAEAIEAAKKYDEAIGGLMVRLKDLGNEIFIPLMDIIGDAVGAFNQLWDTMAGNDDKVDELNEKISEQNVIIANNAKLIEDYAGRAYEKQRAGYERNIEAAKAQVAAYEAERDALLNKHKSEKLVSSTPIGPISSSNKIGASGDYSGTNAENVKKAEKDKTKAQEKEGKKRTKNAQDEAEKQENIFADMVGNSIENAQSLDDFVGNMYSNMSAALMGYVGDWVSQQIIMATASETATAAEGTRKVAEGTATANSAAIKSYDALASIPYIGPALGFAAAAASWAFSLPLLSNIKAAFGGAAHGGLTNVPSEQTYLLQRGERVLSPNQNSDLTSYLSSGGGGDQISINVNANNMSPEATARAIERALKRKNKRTDRAISRAGSRGAQNMGAMYG